MKVPRRYSALVHEKSGWWGTYPVPYQLQVGDYVVMNDEGEVNYLGSVLDFDGWKDKLRVEPFAYAGQEVMRAFAIEGRGAAASAGVDVAGAAVSTMAELTVSFSHAAGYVLVLKGTRGTRFRSVTAAKRMITPVLDAGNWERDWALITEVIHVDSVTALIAEEDSSVLALAARAAVPALDLVTIADPSLNLSSHVRSGSVYTCLCAEATPLFHCLRVKRGFLGQSMVPSGDDGTAEDDLFVDDPWGESHV